jgi:hypothetical protein
MHRVVSSVALATAVVASAALSSTCANANTVTESFAPDEIIYTLDVGLSDGGVLKGTITVFNFGPGGSNGIGGWDLMTTGGNQPSEIYTSVNPPVSAHAIGPYYQPTGWDFFAGTYKDELQLSFAGNLITGAGVYLLGGGASFECYDSFSCPNGSAPDFEVRFVTPLPATWTMLIAGFVGLGFFAYPGATNKGLAAIAAT